MRYARCTDRPAGQPWLLHLAIEPTAASRVRVFLGPRLSQLFSDEGSVHTLAVIDNRDLNLLGQSELLLTLRTAIHSIPLTSSQPWGGNRSSTSSTKI